MRVRRSAAPAGGAVSRALRLRCGCPARWSWRSAWRRSSCRNSPPAAISSRLGKYGDVQSVHVSAFPAIELLWGDADSVTVHARSAQREPGADGQAAARSARPRRIDLTADPAREGPLPLHDVRAEQARREAPRAGERRARPTSRRRCRRASRVQLLGSSGGEVEVRASGGLFGVGASVDAVAEAERRQARRAPARLSRWKRSS